MSDISVMTDVSIGEEKLTFDNSAVSKILGVQDSTLRKYCTLMQKYHYKFAKNSVGHRIFYNKDVDVLKKIIDLKKSSSLTLEEVVKVILESNIDDTNGISDIATILTSDYSKILEGFSTFTKEQTEFNKHLIEQLQKQEIYIKNSIEARDQKLMLLIKESMEVKRQIVDAITEVKNKDMGKYKKAWWQFWK
ncbi:MerR family transcriptional regulator [Lysinibacillus endophyticus]|uniref:MerR family transcriptional regulator n=1 Tax=Ureibacillus endophyticus TaxID=1978490 RepID=A0A494YR48_9BACL|nr:MerR family transcriptional regulator [Lysinibacillus endophyticus]MCP1146822.1 MerR family transcriptional regulator [Lysinibacillus endophyticus]RKQ11297.1 MerR family transcriptional regulator [Lysinibacillus endophyticus]